VELLCSTNLITTLSVLTHLGELSAVILPTLSESVNNQLMPYEFPSICGPAPAPRRHEMAKLLDCACLFWRFSFATRHRLAVRRRPLRNPNHDLNRNPPCPAPSLTGTHLQSAMLQFAIPYPPRSNSIRDNSCLAASVPRHSPMLLAKNPQMRFHITMAAGESSRTPRGLTYLLFQ